MGFCEKCGMLVLSLECEGCKRAAEPSLEKRIQETFEKDKHTKSILQNAKIATDKVPILYQNAVKDPDYIQGMLFYKGLNAEKSVIAHPYALAFLMFDKNLGIDIPADRMLTANHDGDLESYQVILCGNNHLKVKAARQVAINNSKAIATFLKTNPFARYVLVPADFNL